jgi:serine/threonine protein kinase
VTLGYVPPEHWPQTESEAGEVFAVAVLIYELLAGSSPFRGANADDVLASIRRGPVPLKKLNPEVPPALDAVVSAALQHDPNKRPQRLFGFLADLDKAVAFPRGDQGRQVRAALANLKSL